MPSNSTQPEETGLEDESPEDEAQRPAARRHGGFNDEGRPYRLNSVHEVEPGVTEDESRLTEEYGERGESPGRQ